jgi:hypothetical protein
MKITRTPGDKRFDGEGEDEEGDEQEEGGPKLIRPQIFPITPIPLSQEPKTLRRPTEELRKKLEALRDLRLFEKKK